jgi:hypothetical protein
MPDTAAAQAPEAAAVEMQGPLVWSYNMRCMHANSAALLVAW